MSCTLCGLCGWYVAALVVIFVVSKVLHTYVWRLGQPIKVKMFDGTRITVVSGDVGASGVYKEIYGDKIYFLNGITLDDVKNPVVVDAGVNIGMFSRYIAEKFPTARVYGAEPVKQLAEVARANTAAFDGRVKIETAGLGKSGGTAKIKYTPTLSFASSMHADEIKATASQNIVDWACAVLIDFFAIYAISAQFSWFIALLRVPYLRVLVALCTAPISLVYIAWRTGGSLPETISECPIITVDELLAKHQAPTSGAIDLFKIDVEGAELLVLEGISDALWPRIRQMTIEVHNLNGRVDQIKRMLASKGFDHVVTGSEDWEVHRLLHLQTIFARRTRG